MLVELAAATAFCGIASLVFLATRWFAARGSARVQARVAPHAIRESGAGRWLGEALADDLATQIPQLDADTSRLEIELRQAGCYRPHAVRDYLAVRNLLTLATAVAAGLGAVMVGPERPNLLAVTLAAGAFCTGMSWGLPRVVLKIIGNRRQERIRRALPNALDLVSMCLAGGLALQDALVQVCREIEVAHPDLAFELEVVRQQGEMESLAFAFQQFSQRVASGEVEALAALIRQNSRLGTDVTEAFDHYAEEIRLKRRQVADEKAGKASVKLMLPISLCLLPAAMILLWGPAALELFDFFANFDETGLFP